MSVAHQHETQIGVYVAVPASVPIARHFAVDVAQKCGWPDPYTLEVLVSELVTNSAKDQMVTVFTVSIAPPYETAAGRYIEVRVRDDSPTGPVERPMTLYGESGRGIPMVSLLSDHWHWEPNGNGKLICVTLKEELAHEQQDTSNSAAAVAA